MPNVFVIGKYGTNPYPNAIEVDTTSRGPFKDLSPFYLGPISWKDDIHGNMHCRIFENLWQYSKVYQQHAFSPTGVLDLGHPFMFDPTKEYYGWRAKGFLLDKANRYPMGKGVKPLYSLWNNTKYDYIAVRKILYIPVYAWLVKHTESFFKIRNWFRNGRDIVLRDFDGYDHESMGMTLKDVVENQKRPMGHAFVIKMILKEEKIS
jgi:hypothetical protein